MAPVDGWNWADCGQAAFGFPLTMHTIDRVLAGAIKSFAGRGISFSPLETAAQSD